MSNLIDKIILGDNLMIIRTRRWMPFTLTALKRCCEQFFKSLHDQLIPFHLSSAFYNKDVQAMAHLHTQSVSLNSGANSSIHTRETRRRGTIISWFGVILYLCPAYQEVCEFSLRNGWKADSNPTMSHLILWARGLSPVSNSTIITVTQSFSVLLAFLHT